MDFAGAEKEKVQTQVSWIPATPVKPILPRPDPICTPGQENQLNQINCSGSSTHSCSVPDYNVNARYEPSQYAEAEQNGRWSQSEAVSHDKTSFSSNNVGFFEQSPINIAAWNMGFADLLALADAASETQPIAATWADAYVEQNNLVSSSKSLLDNISESSSANTSLIDQNPSPEPNPHNNGQCIPQQPCGMASPGKVISSLTPITPDKATEERCRVDSEMRMCSKESKDQESKNKDLAISPDENVSCIQELPQTNTPACLSSDALSMALENNQNDELKRTPSKKPRRKKHRPKVIAEGEPKRTPKPATPKPASSNERPNGKRKYVRKKGIDQPSIDSHEVSRESTYSILHEETKKSRRRSLNFDLEQPQEESSTCKSFVNSHYELQGQDFHGKGFPSKPTAHVEHEKLVGISYDLTSSVNQMAKDCISHPETQAPITPLLKRDLPTAKSDASSSKNKNGGVQGMACDRQKAAEIILNAETKLTYLNAPSTDSAILNTGQMERSKRQHSVAIECADTGSINLIGAHYNGLDAYQAMCWSHFPYIHKKKRSEKGQSSSTFTASSSITSIKQVEQATNPQGNHKAHTSELNFRCFISGSDSTATKVPITFNDAEVRYQNKTQTLDSILALSRPERSTKRRSRVAKVCNMNLLSTIGGSMQQYHACQQPENVQHQRVESFQQSQTCMDALVAATHSTLARKKRTRKIQSNKNKLQGMKLDTSPGAWNQTLTMDALIEQLEHLSINRGSISLAHLEQHAIVPYKAKNQECNALTLYERDGTIIPFAPIRKRHPRPKVDLDEETTRVWKLLMDSIDSQGIDGTDEDNAKKWEEDRRIFHGRVDSFIARMHLIQGDRRFSKWKGSVLDSVIGVFLTQNVSDHLSSSAFMSLAARFPSKLSSNHRAYNDEISNLAIKKPGLLILEREFDNKWDEKCLNQSNIEQSSITSHDIEPNKEKYVIYSNSPSVASTGVVNFTDESKSVMLDKTESGIWELLHNTMMYRNAIGETEKGKACSLEVREVINDANSSQASGDSSIDQNVEKIGSCADSNSEAEDLPSTAKHTILDKSTSFVKLLELADSAMLNHGSMPSYENSNDVCNPPKHIEFHCQSENVGNSNSIQSSAGLSFISSSNSTLTQNSGAPEIHYTEISKIQMFSSDYSQKKDENNMKIIEAESANQAKRIQSRSMLSGDPKMAKLLQNNMQQDLLTSSSEIPNLTHKTAESGSHTHSDTSRNNFSELSAATTNSKRKKVGKKQGDGYDWDSLREQALANGRKERTESTMDSLNWEAVRCADVNDIADAIRERGMNNMLAERIKDFLNRLVKEHGSTDLEWLRDVLPDKAKEYLLSIRGLGLKSVECVRLLTLHHLAFPVDTNVGRIAVRLGWVPLQPLPESLQLHLLELYPVLESIQKYLWPRLCKLDQRTLYELHYQMITFGKVFCTKNKPNCNACPLRAECRHFASAFASARLALPGPEQRAIEPNAESETTDLTPAMINGQLPLPLPQPTGQAEESQQMEASWQLEGRSRNVCLPIIEEPRTPEPEAKQIIEEDIEDTFYEDPDEIPTIELNIEELTLNLQTYMQQNMELQDGEMSKALVALTTEAASIPTAKLKNVSRLRTEHNVYELPDSHPLLEGLDKRERDDPGKYLLAIWTPGETANSIQPPERKCSSQESGQLCNNKECLSCNSIREANSQIVRGTLLIPCRTAMRGSFPLNGTYFQVNEVFADHDSSLNPINVPRSWIWHLERRTVYFGTSIPTIFKGLSTKEIQECFWRGYVCVRGFDQKTRAPRPLMARLHFPASKLPKTNKGETNNG